MNVVWWGRREGRNGSTGEARGEGKVADDFSSLFVQSLADLWSVTFVS